MHGLTMIIRPLVYQIDTVAIMLFIRLGYPKSIQALLIYKYLLSPFVWLMIKVSRTDSFIRIDFCVPFLSIIEKRSSIHLYVYT